MHELAVCQALIRHVEAIARAHQASAVTRVRVRLGPLSGVEPALLANAFPLAGAGTAAEHAELVIDSAALRVRCDQGGAESDATPQRLVCGACGDYHTRLLSGDEMTLMSVELATEASMTSIQ